MGNQPTNPPNDDFKFNGQNSSQPIQKTWVPSGILIKQSSHEEFSQRPEITYDFKRNQQNQRQAEQSESECKLCLFSSCMNNDNVIQGFSNEDPNRRNISYANQVEGAQERVQQMNPQIQQSTNFNNNIDPDCVSGCLDICELCGDACYKGVSCQNCDVGNIECNCDRCCEGNCDCGGCDCGGCDCAGCDCGGCDCGGCDCAC